VLYHLRVLLVFPLLVAVGLLAAGEDMRHPPRVPASARPGEVGNAGAAAPVAFWVFAHPDDETLAAGVAIARSQQLGLRNVVVIVSSGENTAVGQRLGLTRQETASDRAYETINALAAIGVENIRFLEVPDGQVTTGLVSEVVDGLVREGGHDAAFNGHSPYDSYAGMPCGHPDHCAVATALVDAWRKGEIKNLKLYRIGQFFDGPFGDNCTPFDSDQFLIKRRMVQAYTRIDRRLGQLGIGGQSVPSAFSQAVRTPECWDSPRDNPTGAPDLGWTTGSENRGAG